MNLLWCLLTRPSILSWGPSRRFGDNSIFFLFLLYEISIIKMSFGINDLNYLLLMPITVFQAHVYHMNSRTDELERLEHGSLRSCSAFLANIDERNAASVKFNGRTYNLPPWSVSILPDCQNVVFNTAKVRFSYGISCFLDRSFLYVIHDGRIWFKYLFYFHLRNWCMMLCYSCYSVCNPKGKLKLQWNFIFFSICNIPKPTVDIVLFGLFFMGFPSRF